VPEFTLKQLIAELKGMGFTVRETKKGHFLVEHNNKPVIGFAESHGSRTKRGMVKAPYVYNIRKICKAWLDNLPS
jgi:hypothetical protein